MNRKRFYQRSQKTDLIKCLVCDSIIQSCMGGGIVNRCPKCENQDEDNFIQIERKSPTFKNYWKFIKENEDE